MKLATWSPQDQTLYWKQKQNEADSLMQQKYNTEEAFEKGKIEGIKEGKLKGEIKGEIGKIKMALEKKWEDDQIVKKLKHTHDKFTSIKGYFEQNPTQLTEDDNESFIMGELKLLDD